MTIGFNEIPSNIRVPLFYAEFDNSRAVQGLASQPWKAVFLAQKTSSGTATANVPVLVSSADQGSELFGLGSQMHRMLKSWFLNNKTTEVWACPLADNGAGVAATGSFAFSGVATEDGTIALYAGGVKVEVAVESGDTGSDIATAADAAFDAIEALGVTAAASTSTLNITHKHKGLVGNEFDLRHSYGIDDKLPAGVSIVTTALSGGTTAPDLATAIANLGEDQYNVWVLPYKDADSLAAVEAELLDRWGPVRQNDGMAITCKDDTVGNLTTFGTGRNSKHVVCFGVYKSPTPPEELAGMFAGQIALSSMIDPARPTQTLELTGSRAPAETDRFSWSERNVLLSKGIAMASVAPSGLLKIDRAITMYQENSFGVADISYLDSETLFTLSYLRYSFKARITSKYPRHKLAKDGIRAGVGQPIVTPKVLKAECIAIFRDWEERALVEGIDQFKNDLIVEINGSDPNRVDIRLPPDLVNQFRVCGTQIQFLL